MIENIKEKAQEKSKLLWTIVLTLFFVINLNKDWNRNYIIWYGTLAILLVSYFLVFDAKIVFRDTTFLFWILSFMALCLMSTLWAFLIKVAFDVLKPLVICVLVILFIQFSIDQGFNLDTIFKSYFIATIINAIYIISTIDITLLGDIQLGTGIMDGWNGNGIGFMMAEGVLIGVYLLDKVKGKFAKFLLLIGVIGLSLLTMLTGSRTAFIMLVVGIILYLCFLNPSKIWMILIVSVVTIAVVFSIIMNNESFYKVLGSRFEGLFALFSGEGEVDGSSKIRDTFIENGKQWFLENPILGVGINNYKVLNQQATGRFTYAHNNFIEIAVNLGVVGLAWYYFSYVYLSIKLIKKAKNNKLNAFLLAALVASLISQYGTVSYYSFYQNFLLFLCFNAVNKKCEKENIQA